MFGTSVLENLRVARGDVTRDEATAVLARVALGEWLAGLPDGLDTVLGPDARTVSGGERRRLLVARALLSSAPLLLLDEPAEHLDPATADALVTDLLRDPRGVVVVTHRLSPLGAAHDVLWLDEGRVRARGTHADLQADRSRVPSGARARVRTGCDDPAAPPVRDDVARDLMAHRTTLLATRAGAAAVASLPG